jgi:CMP-2-keto-3-deoxyoctulosonic acid synthetase
VNLQGDEPLFPLDLLRSLAQALPTDPDALWTAADLALAESDRRDEDVVKIVLSGGGERDPSLPPVGESPPRRPSNPPEPGNDAGGGVLDIAATHPLAERRALDFHRLLPSDAMGESAVHVGVYAGSAAAFARFASLPPSDLELLRRIEPLRALHAGMPVRVLVGKWNRVAVDRVEHISMVLHGLKQQGE